MLPTSSRSVNAQSRRRARRRRIGHGAEVLEDGHLDLRVGVGVA